MLCIRKIKYRGIVFAAKKSNINEVVINKLVLNVGTNDAKVITIKVI